MPEKWEYFMLGYCKREPKHCMGELSAIIPVFSLFILCCYAGIYFLRFPRYFFVGLYF